MNKERFGIVKELEFKNWHREWPIDIIRGVLTKDTLKNELLLQLKILNVNKREIKSLYIDIFCYDDSNEIIVGNEDKIRHIYQDIDLKYGEIGGSKEGIKLFNINVRNVKIILNKVVYADGEVRNYSDESCIDKTELEIINNLDDKLVSFAKSEFNKNNNQYELKYIPKNSSNGYWICGCGQYNQDKNEKCLRCKIKKSHIFEITSKEYFDKYLEEEKKKRDEEEKKKRAEEEKEYLKKCDQEKEKKKRQKTYLSISLVTIVGIVMAIGLISKINLKKYDYNNTFIAGDKWIAAIDKKGKLLSTGFLGLKRSEGEEIKELCKDWDNLISLAGDTNHVVGLKSDGTVVAEGKGGWGFKTEEIAKWTDIIQIATGPFETVGLKKDGTVVVSKSEVVEQERLKYIVDKEYLKDVEEWQDIAKIYHDNEVVVGLKSDGTVVASVKDSSLYARRFKSDLDELKNWSNIKELLVENEGIIGLKKDGTVVAIGYNTYNQFDDISKWTDIKKIVTDGSMTVGLKSDGTVVATGRNTYGNCNVQDEKDIVDVFATGSFILGSTVTIDKTGNLKLIGMRDDIDGYGIYEKEKDNWGDVNKIEWGREFIVGLRDNGKATIITADKDSKEWGIEEILDWENIRVD